MFFGGEEARFSVPQDAIRAGVALIPAGRLSQAGVATMTLVENLTLPTLDRHKLGPLLRRRQEAAEARAVLPRYGVTPSAPVTRPLADLSGGNQQKLLVAKWLEADPRLLLLHEPTQGVDIGSRQQLFKFITARADDGCAVLLASSDYAEIASMCHRVFVFYGGEVVAELKGSQVEEDRIAELALRGKAAEVAA
jgi:ribose transport system ATP-binding protein